MYLKTFDLLSLEKEARITMAEDVLVYLSSIKKVKTLNECLYHYDCTNENSATHTKNEAKIKSFIKDYDYVVDKMSKFPYLCPKCSFLCKMFIYTLQIYRIQTILAYFPNTFKEKISLKLQRKILKLKRKFLIRIWKIRLILKN